MINRVNNLQYISKFKDTQIIKVITGVRRCGKSTLLEMFRDELLKNGIDEKNTICINFEDIQFSDLDSYLKVYNYINERVQKDSMNYIFLDEIQLIPDFQKAVDSLFIKKNCDIYITGSNAYLLSGELSTLLSGRYVEIHLLPLSFSEYKQAFPEETSLLRLYRNYLEFSSFPYALQLKNDIRLIHDYLSGIYNTIILKDIVARKGISEIAQLESIIKFLADNIGNICSIKKIADTMTSDGRKISTHTVESYIDSLCKSFIFYKVQRFDVKGKQILKSGEKYYLCDLGLRTFLLGRKYADRGFILENIVYLELLRRGYKVFIGKTGEYEIDFIAQNENGTEYYQVTESMHDEQTRNRELRALESVKDHNPKYVICLDDESIIDYNGIKQIYALDWLVECRE